MSSPNSELLEVLAGAPGAFADSSSEASFECPSLLIEYDNTQDRANHIHSVWRDLRRDFAGDLLAQHYAGVRH